MNVETPSLGWLPGPRSSQRRQVTEVVSRPGRRFVGQRMSLCVCLSTVMNKVTHGYEYYVSERETHTDS